MNDVSCVDGALGNDYAFAGCEAVGFDDDRVFRVFDCMIGFRGRRTLDESRGRNSIRAEELFGETLARFQTRLICNWTNRSQTSSAEDINYAFAQRHLRPDNGQIYTAIHSEFGEVVN